jgi:hypothetical protein
VPCPASNHLSRIIGYRDFHLRPAVSHGCVVADRDNKSPVRTAVSGRPGPASQDDFSEKLIAVFWPTGDSHNILTARAASSATTASEIVPWSIINSLPQRARTGVSVGDKAVLVLKARNR